MKALSPQTPPGEPNDANGNMPAQNIMLDIENIRPVGGEYAGFASAKGVRRDG